MWNLENAVGSPESRQAACPPSVAISVSSCELLQELWLSSPSNGDVWLLQCLFTGRVNSFEGMISPARTAVSKLSGLKYFAGLYSYL